MPRAKAATKRVSSKPSLSSKSRIPSLGGLKRVLSRLNVTYVLVIALVFAAFLIGILGTMVFYGNKAPSQVANITTDPNAQAQPTPVEVSEKQVKDLFVDKYIHFGDANKKNLFVEVADPSCPFCHAADGLNTTIADDLGAQFKTESQGGSYVAPLPKMRELVDQGNASYVFIYSNGHGNGELGTLALYCAYDQGKFWETHDKLMTSEGYDFLNNTVKNDVTRSQEIVDFIGPAVDQVALKTCIDSKKYTTRLSEENAFSATNLGVQGTPGFFINTQYFNGAFNWNDMKSAAK